jgi:hypothetical protein
VRGERVRGDINKGDKGKIGERKNKKQEQPRSNMLVVSWCSV